MQPSTKKRASVAQIWNFSESKWESLPDKNELLAHGRLLVELIRLKSAVRDADLKMKEAGEFELISFYYKLLERDGFQAVQDKPDMKQAILHMWHMVDRYKEKKISWDTLRDDVERMYLSIVARLEKMNRFPGMASNG